MKPNLLISSLTVAASALLPGIVVAAPPAHAPARLHRPAAAKRPRQALPARRFPLRGKAFILHGAVPGGDPDRMDHMAVGKGMHPEQMDHMNAARPAPTTPSPKR